MENATIDLLIKKVEIISESLKLVVEKNKDNEDFIENSTEHFTTVDEVLSEIGLFLKREEQINLSKQPLHQQHYQFPPIYPPTQYPYQQHPYEFYNLTERVKRLEEAVGKLI